MSLTLIRYTAVYSFSSYFSVLTYIRHRIEKEVINHTGLILGNIDYTTPKGDIGLFGPESICWKVHRDFSCMLVGGMSALLLQMLHPSALAGVWDYSNFKSDLLGRLRRTGQFIAATTFASRQDAFMMIERVKKIHHHISGTTAYGQPYAADDADLLTWVHVAEMRSFLQAYLRYKNPDLSIAAQNQYFKETASIAEALGAKDIPTSVSEINDYLNQHQPDCLFDQRTQTVLDILGTPPANNKLSVLFAKQALHAGIDLLPASAQDFYLPYSSNTQRRFSRTSIRLIAPILRWAVRDSSYYRSCQRIGISPSD